MQPHHVVLAPVPGHVHADAVISPLDDELREVSVVVLRRSAHVRLVAVLLQGLQDGGHGLTNAARVGAEQVDVLGGAVDQAMHRQRTGASEREGVPVGRGEHDGSDLLLEGVECHSYS